eukprot:gene20792-biopygen23592
MGLGPHPVEPARRGRAGRGRARRGVRNAQRLYVWGWGPSCTAPKKRPRPRPRLYVWGWGPSCTAPPCSAGA